MEGGRASTYWLVLTRNATTSAMSIAGALVPWLRHVPATSVTSLCEVHKDYYRRTNSD